MQEKDIEAALSVPRLRRYALSEPYDRKAAIRLYVWNAALSEAFQFPLHIAEVVCRNAIQKALRTRFENPWYEQRPFLNLLSDRERERLRFAVNDERTRHERGLRDDHIVASLHFGFWDHLTTKRFERTLWLRGIGHTFPYAAAEGRSLHDINILIQRVRQWRNRIAHHKAIFDREPSRKYDATLTLIRWIYPEVAAWVDERAGIRDLLSRRPG